MTSADVVCGDAVDVLSGYPDGVFQTCITSPPYYQLRDYGDAGQIGLESTPEEYIARLCVVFREVKRVLRDDGTLWLVIGDTYAHKNTGSAKRKDLLGIPWMLAFALRSMGWHLRQDVIWAKSNPMPESVRDRCTRSHDHVFMLAKSEKYAYYSDAISEPAIYANSGRTSKKQGEFNGKRVNRRDRQVSASFRAIRERRNKRDVWTIATRPFLGDHRATFPEELVELCLKASTKPGDAVLDPFAGSGTVGAIAAKYDRSSLSIDIVSDYCEMAKQRVEPFINQAQINFDEVS